MERELGQGKIDSKTKIQLKKGEIFCNLKVKGKKNSKWRVC